MFRFHFHGGSFSWWWIALAMLGLVSHPIWVWLSNRAP